jgi:hypothetical protein
MAAAFKALESLRGFDSSQLKYLQSRMDSMMSEFTDIKEAYEKLMLLDTLANKVPE